MPEVDGLLRMAVDMGASDLHLKAGSPPAVRLATRLIVNHEFPALTPGELEELAMSIMAENQRSQFAKHHEADFAYSLPNVGRFRVNIFMQRGSIGMTLRQVATRRATVAELNLPPSSRSSPMNRAGSSS